MLSGEITVFWWERKRESCIVPCRVSWVLLIYTQNFNFYFLYFDVKFSVRMWVESTCESQVLYFYFLYFSYFRLGCSCCCLLIYSASNRKIHKMIVHITWCTSVHFIRRRNLDFETVHNIHIWRVKKRMRWIKNNMECGMIMRIFWWWFMENEDIKLLELQKNLKGWFFFCACFFPLWMDKYWDERFFFSNW